MFKKIKTIIALALLFVMTATGSSFAAENSNSSKQVRSTLSADLVMSPTYPTVGDYVTAEGSAHCFQMCGAGFYHFDMMLQKDFKKPVVTAHTNLPVKEFKLRHKDVWMSSDYCWSYDSGQVFQPNLDMWIGLDAKAQTQRTGRHWGKWGSGSWAPDVFATDYVEVTAN